MKKRILSSLALFVALALTSCGGNTNKSSSSSPASQSSTAPVSSSVAPASTTEPAPASTTEPAPASTSEEAPVSSETAPVSSEEAPISSEVEPSSEAEPISSEAEPASSEEAPVSSEETPASSSEEAPASSEVEPSSSAPSSSSSSRHQHTFDETVWEHNDNNHWHPATCEHTNQKGNNEKHTFEEQVDDPRAKAATCQETGVKVEVCTVCGYEKVSDVAKLAHIYSDFETTQEATCAQAGSRTRTCTECGYEDVEEIAKLAHSWQATEKEIAEEEGYAKLTQYKCEYGDHYALRWNAQDMDEAASIEACGLTAKDTTIYSEINTSGSHAGSIRLRKAENDGGTEAKGTHAIYKIKVGAAVENVGLEFEIDPKSGYDVPIFDFVDGDAQQGYVRDENDQLVLTTKRYGLRVNGEEITLGADNYGLVNGGSKLRYDWNVSFDLQEGENIIDVYCLGGYRAYIYNFQVTGLPENA